jgi:Sigma 54 modulation protein / S30EA ribosomal protein
MRELMMLIEVRTDGNIQGSEQLSDEVKTVVQTTLDRFSDRIRRVDLYLSDATGNKAGHDDKCCKIEARRDGREPIVVTHHEATMDQAIRGAVHSLKKSVESAFGKESTLDHLRDHH